MSDQKNRLRRLTLVNSVKKHELEKEQRLLVHKQNVQIEALRKMEFCRSEYLLGIERLNKERASLTRDKLEPLEGGLEKLKTNWMQAYRLSKDLEKEVIQQRHVVQMAQANLDSIGKLKQAAKSKLFQEQEKTEQKKMDEIAIQRFARGNL